MNHYDGWTHFGPAAPRGAFVASVGISIEDAAPARRSKQKVVSMHSGKITKWLDKGYGFAKTADGDDVFVHCSALPSGLESLQVGTAIEFEIVTDPRNPARYRAAKVALR